jgi:hypothetical protein
VRRRIDMTVLPIFLITQALQFMDRTALNYANLFNYQKALGLHGSQFNYLTASESTRLDKESSRSITLFGNISSLRWILRWPIPMRLACRALSGAEGHGHYHILVGLNGDLDDPSQDLFTCP